MFSTLEIGTYRSTEQLLHEAGSEKVAWCWISSCVNKQERLCWSRRRLTGSLAIPKSEIQLDYTSFNRFDYVLRFSTHAYSRPRNNPIHEGLSPPCKFPPTIPQEILISNLPFYSNVKHRQICKSPLVRHAWFAIWSSSTLGDRFPWSWNYY